MQTTEVTLTTRSDKQLDDFVSELWLTASRIMKRTRHLGQDTFEDYDITGPQMFAMWQLRDASPMTMGELAEGLSVTHGVATRMVDRLIEKGMVERTRDDGDRRVVRVSLTKLGATVTEDAVAQAIDVVRDVFRDVPQSDREEYLSLLKRIEAAQEGAQAQSPTQDLEVQK